MDIRSKVKDVLIFFAGVGRAREATGNLLVLDESRTADPRRMWRVLQVFLSWIKEPMFFSREERYARGLDRYEDEYLEGAANYPVRAEHTLYYLYCSDNRGPQQEPTLCRKCRWAKVFRHKMSYYCSRPWKLITPSGL